KKNSLASQTKVSIAASQKISISGISMGSYTRVSWPKFAVPNLQSLTNLLS
nr:reverse transcriptase [Hepatitis B virus]